MKLSKKYSVVSVKKRRKRVPPKLDDISAYGRIRRSLSEIASRVGSTVGMEQNSKKIVFYLEHRPKDRQGRLDWNKEVERVSGVCKASLTGYESNITVARNGHELELKRK